MKSENKLYTHEELVSLRDKLSERLIKILKKSGVGSVHFAEMSGLDVKQVRMLLEKSYKETKAVLKQETLKDLDYYISLLEKMVKVGFLPVPNTYSSHCRKYLIDTLIDYYLERVNNKVPLDSYKDVDNLEPTEAERKNKFCF